MRGNITFPQTSAAIVVVAMSFSVIKCCVSLLQPNTRGQLVSECCNLPYEESFVVDRRKQADKRYRQVLKQKLVPVVCLLPVRHSGVRVAQINFKQTHLHAQIILHILFCTRTSAG